MVSSICSTTSSNPHGMSLVTGPSKGTVAGNAASGSTLAANLSVYFFSTLAIVEFASARSTTEGLIANAPFTELNCQGPSSGSCSWTSSRYFSSGVTCAYATFLL
jgi:hypothetical protein